MADLLAGAGHHPQPHRQHGPRVQHDYPQPPLTGPGPHPPDGAHRRPGAAVPQPQAGGRPVQQHRPQAPRRAAQRPGARPPSGAGGPQRGGAGGPALLQPPCPPLL